MNAQSHLPLPPEFTARLVAAERTHRRQQRRAAVILAVSVILGIGVLVYAVNEFGKAQQAPKVVIDPAKLPPIKPGPPR